MKKLFTLILLMIVINSIAQTIHSSSIYNVERFTKDCLDDLSVTGDSIIIYIINPNTATNTDPHVSVAAFDKNTYLIYIPNNATYDNYIKILSHEIVHISQFHNNKFKYNETTKYNSEYDKFINYDVKYENEANKIGAELITKHLKFRQ